MATGIIQSGNYLLEIDTGWDSGSFRLDDSMAMNPANALSQHKEVALLARISASGNPIAQPGDLESPAVNVAVGAADVSLVIDRVVR